ncbi:Pfs NACHT and ankyrin domain protein [Penicillium cosmopolitanum]|uniref:Pfs NACHT and ankyrin domain protein n=1 Tax=Penicillium cosmopolitanum TaxID=1131564 RepID=A0A9W9WAB6_9EURO|nr:Pfs NACHT and ankyrin domain protein [Penicillium cosmopolitanum]KAJ5413811.1 Pfs NACHT and ankyrin domain protein [Penicillium cosmopolitanum]
MSRRSKKNPGYAHQGLENDRLFKVSCGHVPGPDCRGCDTAEEVQRDPRDTTEPEIYYGTIASGNTLAKDAAARDRMVADLGEDCICFEMEASGLMNHFPCLVIRGYATMPILTKTIDGNATLRRPPLVQQQIDRLQQTTVAMKATTDSIKSDLRTHEIKGWLNPADPSTNVNQARKLHYKGTGVWLLDNPVFRSWYSGPLRHIWLHGLAGCGKTVLSTTVLDHLAKANDSPLLNFFFDFKWQDQPKTEALWDIFYNMLRMQKRVSIVLDALDESTSRDDILERIEDIISRPELAHVQLLYTSRPESEFLRRIPTLIGEEGCLPLDEQAIKSDIRLWVSEQLSQRREFTEKPLSWGILEEIRKKVGDGADGMFRWAFCQLDSLARCRHEAAIEEALVSLPKNLNETYERMMKSIPVERKMDAIRLLQFLVHSKRPLTLAEAKEVIATQIENESTGFDIKRRLFSEIDLLDYCPGLATIVHATDKELHLAHFSVKEFLLRDNNFQIKVASISITTTCLTYLTDIKGSHEHTKRQFPMARYASKSVKFFEEEVTFQRWSRLYQADESWDDDPGPPRASKLYYACLNGLLAPAADLINKGENINSQGGGYSSALQAASFHGHHEIVKLLLDNEADVNAQGGRYDNALQAAFLDGDQEIVKLLLDRGADINAQGGEYTNAL